MTSDRQTRITISGLTPEQVLLIKDAAHYSRKTIRDYVLGHAQADLAEKCMDLTPIEEETR